MLKEINEKIVMRQLVQHHKDGENDSDGDQGTMRSGDGDQIVEQKEEQDLAK